MTKLSLVHVITSYALATGNALSIISKPPPTLKIRVGGDSEHALARKIAAGEEILVNRYVASAFPRAFSRSPWMDSIYW